MWTKHTQLLPAPPSSCPGEGGHLIHTVTWGGSAAMATPPLHVLPWEAAPSASPCGKRGGRGGAGAAASVALLRPPRHRKMILTSLLEPLQ